MEVGHAPGTVPVPVRDSKDPNVGHLIISATAWTALTASLRT
ncbi:DUF397 domain-containing protein [Embleya scabrispora]|nr:DUF397 domain-containing protein [Embleya scabrispora]